jgi:hypothetical protein
MFQKRKRSFVKRLLDRQRLRDSQNPRVKGYPTKRSKTTTSCGLDPRVKGHLTKRPETTTSCGPEKEYEVMSDPKFFWPQIRAGMLRILRIIAVNIRE